MKLFESCYGKAFALALGRLKRRDLAGEVVSEAFFKLLTMEHKRFTGIKNLSSYLLTIVRNGAEKLRKKQQLIYPLIEGFDTDWTKINSFIHKLFDKMNPEPEVESLLNLLSQEHPQYAQILRLFYLRNLSHKEITTIMNITETHSKVMLYRAKAALKKLYDSLSPDDDPERSKGKKNSSVDYGNLQSGFGNTEQYVDENDIIDYIIGDLQGSKKVQIELLTENDFIYREILEGYIMLLEDFSSKEKVLQFLDNKKEQLLGKLSPYANSSSDDIVNDIGEAHDNTSKNVEIQTAAVEPEFSPRHYSLFLGFDYDYAPVSAYPFEFIYDKLLQESEKELINLSNQHPEKELAKSPFIRATSIIEETKQILKALPQSPYPTVLFTGETGVGKEVAAYYLQIGVQKETQVNVTQPQSLKGSEIDQNLWTIPHSHFSGCVVPHSSFNGPFLCSSPDGQSNWEKLLEEINLLGMLTHESEQAYSEDSNGLVSHWGKNVFVEKKQDKMVDEQVPYKGEDRIFLSTAEVKPVEIPNCKTARFSVYRRTRFPVSHHNGFTIKWEFLAKPTFPYFFTYATRAAFLFLRDGHYVKIERVVAQMQWISADWGTKRWKLARVLRSIKSSCPPPFLFLLPPIPIARKTSDGTFSKVATIDTLTKEFLSYTHLDLIPRVYKKERYIDPDIDTRQ